LCSWSCSQVALTESSPRVGRDTYRHRREEPTDQPWRLRVGVKKAMFHKEKEWGRPHEDLLDVHALDDAIDSAPLRFRPCAIQQKQCAADRRLSQELAPSWSPPRCHYGPDDRAAAVLGTCGDHELARSSRQTSTALEPAGTQHIASGAGGHAGTEAVLLRPAAVIGLERTLHEGPPRSASPTGSQIVAT
jgi:hypothetical protein